MNNIFSVFKTELFLPIPQLNREGIWISAGFFVEWGKIRKAQYIWRFGLPYVKLNIESDEKLIYKNPEIPLFYRDYDQISEEVKIFCPTNHVFYNVLPTRIPKKPYKALYYFYQSMMIGICFVLILSSIWFFSSN